METIKKFIKLSPEQYYAKHLEIINPLLPVSMTPKEIEVLGAFMSLKGDIVDKDRFGTSCRKEVKDRLNLSDGGLGNYIKSLKEKGFILEDSGKLYILPLLMVEDTTQNYMIKIVKV